MQDQTENIKELISQLTVDSARKQALSERLAKEGVTDGLMLEIKTCLNEMEEKLDALLPQEAKDLEKAQQDFDTEMAAIEKEAVELEKKTNQDLDKIQLDSAKAQLK